MLNLHLKPEEMEEEEQEVDVCLEQTEIVGCLAADFLPPLLLYRQNLLAVISKKLENIFRWFVCSSFGVCQQMTDDGISNTRGNI